MITAQVELTDSEMAHLEVWARVRGVSVEEVIRQALVPLLRVAPRPVGREAWERATQAIGSFTTAEGDMSTRHDDIVAEAVQNQ